MRSTSWREIVSPQPVPPYWRLIELSACANVSKIIACFSSGMPGPVSDTENRSAWTPLRLPGCVPREA